MDKSTGIKWMKEYCNIHSNKYMGDRDTLKKIIELYPEIFLDEDIYIDEELTSIWKKEFREKRIGKILD